MASKVLKRNKNLPESGISSPLDIPQRRFGRTGWTLPVLSMGGSAFVESLSPAYGLEVRPYEERVAMVRDAFDRGVRYFDTARAYQESESIMGKALADVRSQVVIASKVADPDAANTRRSVETSLTELGMDHIDVMQIHSLALEVTGFEGAMKMHAELLKLKDEGLIGHIGLTTHVAFETVYRMIDTGGFDQVLLAYGYFNKGMDTMLSSQNIEMRNLCLSRAAELDMAIVSMKVLGHRIFSHNARNLMPDLDALTLQRLPGAAMRWVLQDERVSTMIIGVSRANDMAANIDALRAGTRLSTEDSRLLAECALAAYGTDEVRAMAVV